MAGTSLHGISRIDKEKSQIRRGKAQGSRADDLKGIPQQIHYCNGMAFLSVGQVGANLSLQRRRSGQRDINHGLQLLGGDVGQGNGGRTRR